MRIVTLIIYLFLQLLSGSEVAHANNSPASTALAKQWLKENKTATLFNEDHTFTVIEDTDIDLEEEYAGNALKKVNDTKAAFEKHSFFTASYISKGHLFLCNFYYKKHTTTQPFYGCSSPIYIKNRVLRI